MRKKIRLDPVIALDPNADWAPLQWTPYGAGSAHYDRVSDDNWNTGVLTTVQDYWDWYYLQDLPPLAISVYSIELHIRAHCPDGSGAPEQLLVRWRIGDTGTLAGWYWTVGRLACAHFISGDVITEDPDGLPWTVAKINDLRYGINSMKLGTKSPPETLRCCEAWIAVDYTSAPPADAPGVHSPLSSVILRGTC